VQPVLEAVNFAPVIAEARARAMGQRPEIRQAQLRQKQAEQELRAKRAEYIPDVAAEINGLTLLNFGRFLPLQSNSAGLSVSWEPFDWGRKKHEMAEKKRTIE
jgi:outer membrane protein TolC